MNDLEARLRHVLHEELDPIDADRSRAVTMTRRARRARIVRAGAGVLATLGLLAAAVATAGALGRDDRDLPPAAPPETFAAFDATSEGGRTWRVAVDVEQGQACYGAHVLGAGSVHLRRGDGDAGDPAIATFQETPRAFPSHLCAPVESADAARVIAEPELHYLEFHSGTGSLSGPLAPVDRGEPPAVAEIVCGPRGAVALTPEIQPQRDGIHLEIYNYGGDRGEFYFVAPDGGNEIGNLPADDVHRNVSSFGPGPLQVGCTDYADSFSFDGTGSERHARLTIVDPHDLWTEPDLECGDGRRRRKVVTDRPATEPPGVQPPAETLIREFVSGVEPGDVIERPRYPESMFKLETRTLVRDGRRIARLYLTPEDGVWNVLPYVCPGSGVADWDES